MEEKQALENRAEQPVRRRRAYGGGQQKHLSTTLIVLLLFLPLIFGINGVLYAGPSADVLAAVVSFFVLRHEFRRMWQEAETLDG